MIYGEFGGIKTSDVETDTGVENELDVDWHAEGIRANVNDRKYDEAVVD